MKPEGRFSMKNEWVRALGNMTYGIYVLTTSHEETVNGMIASWVTQVSYEPPLIAAAVHPNRFSHDLIKQSGRFALHVLGKNQKYLITKFMSADPEAKFSGIDWRPGQTGCPVLADCVAFFECSLNTHVAAGNHTLFVGEVVKAETVSGDELLSTLDFRGQYIGKM
jgi:flavin reductase (DIM6/NTAB) family NADH-FMN oxidoreductase RutF